MLFAVRDGTNGGCAAEPSCVWGGSAKLQVGRGDGPFFLLLLLSPPLLHTVQHNRYHATAACPPYLCAASFRSPCCPASLSRGNRVARQQAASFGVQSVWDHLRLPHQALPEVPGLHRTVRPSLLLDRKLCRPPQPPTFLPFSSHANHHKHSQLLLFI